MPGFETLAAVRVVASPVALDAAGIPAGSFVLRIAPDEALVVGADIPVVAGDPHAIVVADHGFSGRWFSADEFATRVAPYIEWALPTARPTLAQGLIAAVAAKVWFADDAMLVLCQSAYADELTSRLGGR